MTKKSTRTKREKKYAVLNSQIRELVHNLCNFHLRHILLGTYTLQHKIMNSRHLLGMVHLLTIV